jgi:hypothetical protein
VKTTSSPQFVTATNTTSTAVNLSGTLIIQSGARDFAQTSDCGTSLAPGAHCTISVTFTPLGVGQFTAYLELHVSTGVSPTGITLTGSGF